MTKKGWEREPSRHSLAARGIESRRYPAPSVAQVKLRKQMKKHEQQIYYVELVFDDVEDEEMFSRDEAGNPTTPHLRVIASSRKEAESKAIYHLTEGEFGEIEHEDVVVSRVMIDLDAKISEVDVK